MALISKGQTGAAADLLEQVVRDAPNDWRARASIEAYTDCWYSALHGSGAKAGSLAPPASARCSSAVRRPSSSAEAR